MGNFYRVFRYTGSENLSAAAPDAAQIPMNHRPITGRKLAAPFLLLLFTAWVAVHETPARAAESRVQVRLVRLLEEVSDSERRTVGNVHDIKLRLEPGNILLLRKGGESAALLPIEGLSGGRDSAFDGKLHGAAEHDSLRYFYYVEHAAFLWVFPGPRDRGIGMVGDGGSILINAFDLKWRAGAGHLGWIYFPDDQANHNVRFSVVSGQTVDEADPMDTKYWVELGPAEASGF